jgi:hypothetical protein
MENLQTIAKNFGLFTVENMPIEYKDIYNNYTNEYQKKQPFEIPSYFNNNNLFEIGHFFECKTEKSSISDNYNYIDNSYILIKYKESQTIFILRKSWNKKDKFDLMAYYDYYNQYNKLSNTLRNKAYNENKEPNAIGVFTDKKVIDWVKYIDNVLQCLKNTMLSNNKGLKESENIVTDFINNLEDKCKVNFWENTQTKHWNIETNIFTIHFTLHTENAYLDKKINFKGDINTILNITKNL